MSACWRVSCSFAFMKNWLFTGLILLVASVSFSVTVSFHHGVFMTPDHETYIETYLLFDGSQVRYATVGDSQYQSSVELTYIFEQRGILSGFSKNIINGPISSDTFQNISDFIDQQRFILKPGKYDLLIMIKDLNNPKDSVRSIQQISVAIDPAKIFFSDVYLVDRVEDATKLSVYTRNGKNYYPKISPFYSPQLNELSFYSELYNTSTELGEAVPYVLSVEITDPGTDEVVDQFRFIQRKKATEIEPVVKKINIQTLPTGSYVLLLQAIDRNGDVLAARSLPFKRFNENQKDIDLRRNPENTFVSKISEDSLRTLCYCMIYQGTDAEITYIENNWKEAEDEELRRFFYSFWQDRNPLDPRLEFARYNQMVKHVQEEYGNNTQHGCGTDRGRIYLKYGEPNSMSIVRNESRAYPYEIWHYYKIPGKSNAKFFFLDAKRINEFTLAHSNVLGEPYDNLWYTRLLRETQGGSQSTQEHQQEAMGLENDPYSHGSRALDYWNNPR